MTGNQPEKSVCYFCGEVIAVPARDLNRFTSKAGRDHLRRCSIYREHFKPKAMAAEPTPEEER